MNPANPIAIEVSYATPANDAAGMPLSLCVFADRSHLRATMCEDATAAGFFVLCAGDIRLLLEGDAGPLGDVVLVDCPSAGGAELAALTRLDVRAAHCGAHLIVSTNVASLDDVFACLDQSGAQILVDPGRGDRVVALGSALSRIPNLRLRDLSENDRLLLLRLTEQRRKRPTSPRFGTRVLHQARGMVIAQHDAVEVLGELCRVGVGVEVSLPDAPLEGAHDEVEPLPLQRHQPVAHRAGAVVQLRRGGGEDAPTRRPTTAVPRQPPIEDGPHPRLTPRRGEGGTDDPFREGGGAMLQHLDLQRLLGTEVGEEPALGELQLVRQGPDGEAAEPDLAGQLGSAVEDGGAGLDAFGHGP